MKVIFINDNITIENKDEYAVCLGMFDGVHIGHRELINKTVSISKEKQLKSAVLTFIKKGETNKIYPLERKIELFKALGLDTVFIIEFTDEFKNCDSMNFINKYLIEYIRAKEVICGFNFKFGKGRQGDISTLEKNAIEYSLSVVSEVKDEDETVSSTAIKEHLKNGNIKRANKLLGSEYTISGYVCEGNKIGRTIDFPTVNIPVDESLCRIKAGVYSSKVYIGEKCYMGISNIGTAPTVRNGSKVILETNLIDFEGDLYNKYITVRLIDFIREERKFKDLSELKATIADNLNTAKIQLGGNI